jgi:hypothetical protein
MMPQIILDPGAGEVRAGRSASDKAAIAAAKANPVAIPDPKNSYTKAQLSKEFYAYVNNVAAQRGIMDLPLADQKYFVNELISLHTRGVSTSEIKKRFVTDLLDYKAKNNLREHSVSPMRQRRT